jgi:hypothetical protein
MNCIRFFFFNAIPKPGFLIVMEEKITEMDKLYDFSPHGVPDKDMIIHAQYRRKIG